MENFSIHGMFTVESKQEILRTLLILYLSPEKGTSGRLSEERWTDGLSRPPVTQTTDVYPGVDTCTTINDIYGFQV